MTCCARKRLGPSLLIAAIALSGSTALADTEGRAGRVVRLTVNAQGSGDYASFHGRVTLRRPGSNRSESYHWGGSTCPAQKLRDEHIALLASAMHNRHKTLVAPRYVEGEGTDTRCLVAFDLVAGS